MCSYINCYSLGLVWALQVNRGQSQINPYCIFFLKKKFLNPCWNCKSDTSEQRKTFWSFLRLLFRSEIQTPQHTVSIISRVVNERVQLVTFCGRMQVSGLTETSNLSYPSGLLMRFGKIKRFQQGGAVCSAWTWCIHISVLSGCTRMLVLIYYAQVWMLRASRQPDCAVDNRVTCGSDTVVELQSVNFYPIT